MKEHDRFIRLEHQLDQAFHDLTMRVTRGFVAVKTQLEGTNTREPPEPIVEEAPVPHAALRRLERGLICLGVLGLLTLGGLGLLWLDHRSLNAELKRRNPTPHQWELMVLGWQHKEGCHETP